MMAEIKRGKERVKGKKKKKERKKEAENKRAATLFQEWRELNALN